MGIDVSVENTISRPPEDVAEYATDPQNEPVWISGIKSARMLTDPPVRLGTQVERIAGFLGKRVEYVLEVTEHDPPRLIAMRTVRGPFPMVVTYRFEPTEAGTRARLRVEGDTSGFYRLAEPLMAAQVKRSLSKDLANLKRILERGVSSAQP